MIATSSGRFLGFFFLRFLLFWCHVRPCILRKVHDIHINININISVSCASGVCRGSVRLRGPFSWSAGISGSHRWNCLSCLRRTRPLWSKHITQTHRCIVAHSIHIYIMHASWEAFLEVYVLLHALCCAMRKDPSEDMFNRCVT